MKRLALGSRGPEVGLLRHLLNRKLRPSPGLAEAHIFGARYNGAKAVIPFGPDTDRAVRAFQRSRKLRDDGVVGPKTWGALNLKIDVNAPVVLRAQPTNDTCYAAAATMVLGNTAAVSFDAGALPPGKRGDDYFAEQYSRLFGWTLEYGVTPTVDLLSGLLSRGPIWIAGDFPFPGNPASYHAVVIGSIWGDGAPRTTMLLIFDPWPPNAGEIYGVIFYDWILRNPLALRYMLHR